MKTKALSVAPEAVSHARNLWESAGSNVCVEEAKFIMHSSNPALHFVVDNMLKFSDFTPPNPAAEMDIQEALWTGAAITQLVLRCHKPGIPIIDPFTVRTARPRNERGSINVGYFVELLESQQELKSIVNEEADRIAEIDPMLSNFLRIGAGCVYYYSDEQYQRNQAAQWN